MCKYSDNCARDKTLRRAGTLIRISGRMQKLIVVGHVDGAVDGGVGGDRWIDYVVSDVQAFDILWLRGKR